MAKQLECETFRIPLKHASDHLSCFLNLHVPLSSNNLYYVSMIPDRYHSVTIFILDRLSVSIGTDFFRHDFRNEEGLECSDSKSDTRCIGQPSIRSKNKNLMETYLERQLGMILRFLSFKSTIINEMFLKGGLVMLIKM